jgi:uncharacterized protein (DUF2062 family)
LIRHHWFRRRVIIPILELLKQGVTPEKLALSLAIGIALGCAPVLGVTTFAAFAICYTTELNPVAMQLMNYVMYPAQLILFIPFIHTGEKLFHAQHLRLNVAQIQQLFHSNTIVALHLLWTAIWHALVVWLVIAPIAVAIIYLILAPVLRHSAMRLHRRRTPAESA